MTDFLVLRHFLNKGRFHLADVMVQLAGPMIRIFLMPCEQCLQNGRLPVHGFPGRSQFDL